MKQFEPLQPIRVLVTGAGGPAAIAVLRSLSADPTITLLAADMDPWASGLFMVDRGHSMLVPRGDDETFVDVVRSLCVEHDVDILVPTVDVELTMIAQRADEFTSIGVALLLSSARVLEMTLDKYALARACASVVAVPRTELLDETDPDSWDFPVIVKPRRGSGSRGVVLVDSALELLAMRPGAGLIVQENLPGDEYSIDVVADVHAKVSAAVPRIRQRVDSGVSVAGYTVRDPELEHFARTVVWHLGLSFISNVQVRRRANGEPALLEINPRVPGSLALTKAAGVDMVALVIDSMRGVAMPSDIQHREVAMVRYLDEIVVSRGDVMDEPHALVLT